MALTLGLTGMDQATEAALKVSFSEGGARLAAWALKSEVDAEYVIVDMDSMYGPMSWLRLHAAGKRVIGLTTAPRTQADYRLPRPFDHASLHALLAEIAQANGIAMPVPQAATAPQMPAQAAQSAPAPAPTPIYVPAPVAAPIAPAPAAVSAPPPVAAPVSAPVQQSPAQPFPVQPAPAQQAAAAAMAALPPQAAQATVPPSNMPADAAEAREGRGTGFADWLRPGALSGRARFQSGKGPALLIDFVQREYFGPGTLKPLAEYFVGPVGLRDFEQLDDQSWKTAAAAAGSDAQPLSRLQWFGALLAGEGRLLPGFNPEGKFQLNKWPQTEREYPRHFRIATAMMKGPMSIAEIATASGVPAPDVVDFINANLTTGFAEPAGAGTDSDPAKGSLLGRLRGR